MPVSGIVVNVTADVPLAPRLAWYSGAHIFWLGGPGARVGHACSAWRRSIP